jgi:8-oxo-dGTP diphosphatase
MNERVAVLICRDDSLLLIRRVKDGREYHVIPGGGVEAGESIAEAARREVLEELGLSITVGPTLWREENRGRMETYIQAASFAGEVVLGGPERQRQSETNQYHPEWVEIGRLSGINLQPETARERILDLVRQGQLSAAAEKRP